LPPPFSLPDAAAADYAAIIISASLIAFSFFIIFAADIVFSAFSIAAIIFILFFADFAAIGRRYYCYFRAAARCR